MAPGNSQGREPNIPEEVVRWMLRPTVGRHLVQWLASDKYGSEVYKMIVGAEISGKTY